MGGVIPAFVIIVTILIFGVNQGHAEEARILLKQDPVLSELQGRFQISCLKMNKIKALKPISCRAVSGDNKSSAFRFDKTNVKVDVKSERMDLVLSNKKVLLSLYGKAFRIQGHFFWQGHQYRKIDVVLGKNKAEWVVHLPLDEYLKGVLGGEVPSSWPEEVLKAQSVASRTYFLWKRGGGDSFNGYYDVVSDHMDQVFKRQKQVARSIEKAIRKTKGLFLKSRLTQKVFPAFFHADCGGATSTEHAVWGHPFSENQPVADVYCKSATRNHWKYSLKAKDAEQVLKELLFLPSGVHLTHMSPRVGNRERAFSVDFVFNDRIIKTLSANEFRKNFGFGKVRSTNFKVYREDESFQFEGQGYGHGVGLCQWGAYRWAKSGKTFQQILAHYYPTAELTFKKKKSSLTF